MKLSYYFFTILFLSFDAFSGAWLIKPKEFEIISKFSRSYYISTYKDPVSKEKNSSKVFLYDYYDQFIQYGINKKHNIGLEFRHYNYKGYRQIYPFVNFKPVLIANRPNQRYLYHHENELLYDNYLGHYENRLTEGKIFWQTQVFSNQNNVFSIQPGLYYNNIFHETKLDLKFLYGFNFKIFKKSSFINFELSRKIPLKPFFKYYDDGHLANLDITFGLDVSKKTMLLWQLNTRFYYKDYNTNNCQTLLSSVVYKFKPYLWLQTGIENNLVNRNKYIERTFVTGLWIKI